MRFMKPSEEKPNYLLSINPDITQLFGIMDAA